MSICEILTQIGSKLAQIPVPDFNIEVEVETAKNDADMWLKRLTDLKSNQLIAYRKNREKQTQIETEAAAKNRAIASLPIEIPVSYFNREFEENKMVFMADYADEIFGYFGQLEARLTIDDDFMKEKRSWAYSRARLIDYILVVHHKSRFINEILYRCVQLIDFFIQATKKENVSFERFSLICAACLFLAIKIESRSMPLKSDLILSITSCPEIYSLRDLKRCEIDILKKIEFKVNKPIPIDFLRCFSQYIDASYKEYTMAKFFMEITLHDHRFSSMNPSTLAAASLTLAFRFYKRPHLQEMMHEIYVHYAEINQFAINAAIKRIAIHTLNCLRPDYKFKGVFFKYADKNLLNTNLAKSQIFEKFIIHQVY